VFEALTAKDRPYKRGKTLTEALNILGRMKLTGHIDPDLFDVFVREKVYLRYADQFLDPAQIDDVDPSAIPGFVG
jgi:HD-GYP domain-containing protein (c-di-GMP phosphodiesterase class II)